MRDHGLRARRPRAWVGVAVSGCLLAAGCSGGEDESVEGARVRDASSTTTTVPPTVTEPTTSTTLSRPDFFRRRAIELFAIRTELLQHPDPARVSEWLSPNCDCWAGEVAIMEEFVTHGRRLDGVDAEILAVELTQDAGDLVVVTIVRRLLHRNIVDAEGNVVRPRPAQEPAAISVHFAQEPDGRWLILALINLRLRPDVLEQVLQKGLP